MKGTLILPIKKKWYDMILSGEKREEYREIKPYYTTRFSKVFRDGEKSTVILRNGYISSSPTAEAECTLRKGTGRTEWGAEEGREYYVLTILEVKEQQRKQSMYEDIATSEKQLKSGKTKNARHALAEVKKKRGI